MPYGIGHEQATERLASVILSHNGDFWLYIVHESRLLRLVSCRLWHGIPEWVVLIRSKMDCEKPPHLPMGNDWWGYRICPPGNQDYLEAISTRKVTDD